MGMRPQQKLTNYVSWLYGGRLGIGLNLIKRKKKGKKKKKKRNIKLHAGVRVDAYHSTIGTYCSFPPQQLQPHKHQSYCCPAPPLQNPNRCLTRYLCHSALQ